MVRPRGKTSSLQSKQGQPSLSEQRRWEKRQKVTEKYAKLRAMENRV